MTGEGRDDGTTVRADVVIIGDGPAGSALAAACVRREVDVVLVGDDRPWTATYGAWIDELAGAEVLRGADIFAARLDSVIAAGDRRHDLARRYGVIDNAALRAALRSDVRRFDARAESTRVGVTHHSVVLDNGRWIRCRLIVRATGRPGGADTAGGGQAWQTAFGVVLPEPPPGEPGQPTFMDFRPVAGQAGPAGSTFLYALPVTDGWLVEETVLAARPAVDPRLLRDRLAARLGSTPDELAARAVRTEVVAIPMGGPPPDRERVIVEFGASAGYIHPATGFSLSASLRAAPRVAEAICSALSAGGDLAADSRPVWDAVWPVAARRTRVLHEYGLARMLTLDGPDVREFFDRFFDLPTEDWAAYLRVDAPPSAVSRTMGRLFRSSSWSIRRRLASGNPLRLARLVRP